MFGNFIKNIANSGFVTFAELRPIVHSSGMIFDLCTFDMNKVGTQVEFSDIKTNPEIIIKGGGMYVGVWYGQIIDEVISKKNSHLMKIIDLLENQISNYAKEGVFNANDLLSKFDSGISSIVRENNVVAQFLIHRQSHGMQVTLMNVPLVSDDAVSLYLLISYIGYLETKNKNMVLTFLTIIRAVNFTLRNDKDVQRNPCQVRGAKLAELFLKK